MPDVVPVTAPDERAAVELLARSGFGMTVGQLVAYPLAAANGALLAVFRDRAPVAVTGVVSFGATGWIGALAVAPEHRREGLGRAVCDAAVAWLRERGAETVLLHATPLGRPLYLAQGFVAERPATAWRGTAAVRLPAPVRPLREGDRPALLALDRETTGEDRALLLDGLQPLQGWAVDGAPGAPLRGVAVGSPYGRSLAVLARDENAGLALLAATASGPAASVVLVPDDNEAARAALRRWRFVQANAPLRMRLGPPPARRPERQFGLFNFFWG